MRSGFLFDGYATAGESIPADVAVEEAEHVAAEVGGYAFARQPILSVSGETEVLQGIGETDLECGDTQEEDDDDRAGAHAVYLTRGLSPLDVSVAVPLSSGQLVEWQIRKGQSFRETANEFRKHHKEEPTTRHGHLAMGNMERAQTIMNSIFETKPRSRPSWENRSACLRQIINVSLLDDSAAICRITLRPCSCNTPSRGIRTFSPTQMLRVTLLGTRGPTATRGVRSQPTQCARGHVIGTLKSARALMRTRPFETLQRG